ncbi:MAG TPA: GatB/YqeY domain-containing protein [Candidatus Binatia bacterium]|jgi:uncharacterized protein YqeY|nr:GatB/YqeY domain-containing protein [Candidatus Binatia bacterium]
MSLLERIDDDLTEARRRHDDVALRALGLLKSEVVRAGKEPGAGGASDDEAVLRVLRREVKRREEAAEAFTSGGRTEAAEREEAEGAILRAYLPAQLDDEQIEREVQTVIEELGASSPKDMGAVMKAATARLQGAAEPGRIAGVARRLLAG